MHKSKISQILLSLAFSAISTYASNDNYNQINAQGFIIPDIVLFAIRNNECYDDGGYCNPNVIRLNKQSDIEKANSNGIYTHGSHVLCYDQDRCSETAEQLIKLGIKNIDLGPYQINYYWNGKYELSGYFDLDVAEMRAREILRGLITQYGYSWTTLGRYHNYDPNNPSRNQKYYKRMQSYIYSDRWKGIRPSDIKQMKTDQKDYADSQTTEKQLMGKNQAKPMSATIADTYPQTQPSEYSLRQEAKLWYIGKVEKGTMDSEKQFEENPTTTRSEDTKNLLAQQEH